LTVHLTVISNCKVCCIDPGHKQGDYLTLVGHWTVYR